MTPSGRRRKLLAAGLVTLGLALTTTAAVTPPTPGITKVIVFKQAANATVPVAPSASLLTSWKATIIQDSPTQMLLDVPQSYATTFRDAMAAAGYAAEVREDFNLLKFHSFAIDARTPDAEDYPSGYTRPLPLPSPARDCFVIQFSQPPQNNWLAAMRAAGITVVDYIPENGYTVIADSNTLSKVTSTMPVQILQLNQPIHKITDALRAASTPFRDISVSIANVPEANDALAFLDTLTLASIRSPTILGTRTIYQVTAATNGLPTLASYPAVIWIEDTLVGFPSGER